MAYPVLATVMVLMLATALIHRGHYGRWIGRQGRAETARRVAQTVPPPYTQAPLPPAFPIVLGKDEFEAWATALIATAEAVSDRHAEFLDNAAIASDYADRFPMPQRPAPPEPAPGEPWQQQVKNDTLAPRPAERPESEINPLHGDH